jgi:hypothetical protein
VTSKTRPPPYVIIDELLEPRRGPGRRPRLADSELIRLTVAQVLLGYRSERRWLRAVRGRLGHLFPYVCGQPAYNRLRRAAPPLALVLRALALACPSWCDQWRLLDATPVPCGASRQTVRRSALAGWAGYGHDRSRTRWYRGPQAVRPGLPGRPAGGLVPGQPKLGERQVAEGLLDQAARQGMLRPGLVGLADQRLAVVPSRRPWPSWAPAWFGPTGPTSQPGSARWARSASGSRPSSAPSKASSVWNATAPTHPGSVDPGRPAAAGLGRLRLVQLAARRSG